MKKILIPVALMAITFISCNKDKSEDCTKPVTTDNVAGTYKLTSLKYKSSPSSTETEAIDSFLEACEKDDLFVLNANGNFSYQDAGTACSPSGSFTGTWSVTGNTITIDGETETVKSFDCHALVTTTSDGGTGTFTATYSRQ